MTLAELERLARHELTQLRYPAPNWVLPRNGPDGRAMLDVLVIGGGLCGPTASLTLLCVRVSNPPPHGPTARCGRGTRRRLARPEHLRSPHHPTTPQLGI